VTEANGVKKAVLGERFGVVVSVFGGVGVCEVRGTSLHKGANNFCPEWCYSGYFGEKVADMIRKT